MKARAPINWSSLKTAGLFLVLIMIGVGSVFRLPFQPDDSQRATPVHEAEFNIALDQVYADQSWRRSVAGTAVAYIDVDGNLTTWTSGNTSALGGRPVTDETVFEVASLSKPLTAYAILRLADLGQLDLDATRTVNGFEFTLRQVLSHSAGFDNRLPGDPEPEGLAGTFEYAGAGYLYLAQQIEAVTGQSFEDHMNTVVLPELGMTSSRFGRAAPGLDALAMPALDVSFGFAMVALVAGLIAIPLLLIAFLVQLVFRKNSSKNRCVVAVAIAGLSIVCGFALDFMMIGAANWSVMAPAIAALFAALIVAAVSWKRGTMTMRALAGGLIIVTVSVLAVRPALPQSERRPSYLAAAGLRTTASDYARFMHTVLNSDSEPVRAMLQPAVSVSENNGWGPGFAVQTTGDQAIWHWGVNFPGYQAFTIGWVDQRDAMVVLNAGGAIAISPSGIRYSGLELAYDMIDATAGRLRGSYWGETG